jgi:hypothetical protein
MSQLLWIIDPDPTSAQSMRSAVDLLGPAVETFDHVPSDGELAQAVLIAGAAGAEHLDRWIGELRRRGGNDLLPVTIVGGLSSSAEALALGADHYLPSPLILAELWDHLRRFLNLTSPDDGERELIQSRGFITPEITRSEPPAQISEDFDSRATEDPISGAPFDDQSSTIGDAFLEPIDPRADEPDDVFEAATRAPQIDELGQINEEEETPSDVDSAPAEEANIEPQSSAAQSGGLDAQEASSESELMSIESLQADEANHQDLADESADEPMVATQEPIQAAARAEDSEPVEALSAEDGPADQAEDLFGLKQPEEVDILSAKSGKETFEALDWTEERPQNNHDLEADAAWGLDEAVESNEPATAGWDEEEDSAWGNEAQSDGDWNTNEEGWADQASSDEGWGESSDTSSAWGDDGPQDEGWGGAAEAPKRSSSLTQIGEQLMPATPKPRAPVSSLGQLGSTGLLGVLARCGKERVSGRITWRSEHESIVLHLEEGRLKAMHSGSFDHDLLQAAFAQSWIDQKELAGVRHLMQRRHASAASVLSREGVRASGEIQKLAQDTAERILLRCTNAPGGHAEFHPEMGLEHAVAVSQVDMISRLITLCESLVQASIWIALVGGDDAVPALMMTPLPDGLPGRDALHSSDGRRSLLELATASGVSIHDVRSGCLAALAIGHVELIKVGVSAIQKSHRPDQTFERALRQIRSGDYFTVLGLAEAHSATEVHRAFAARVSLLRLHLHTNHPRFAEAYQELEEAREVLLDPDLRAQYRSANPKLVER